MKLVKPRFVISLLLKVLLVYASGTKLLNYIYSGIGFDFFPFVKNYHRIVFWGLIIVQLIMAGLLLFRSTRLFGLYSVFFLLAFLSTYLHVMLRYAVEVPCACTGIIPSLSWNGHLLFTIAFTILAGINIALLPDKEIHARG